MSAKTNWNGWKITDEQAELIRNCDLDARNRFWFDNLDRLRAMAYNYGRRNPRCYGMVDDMVNCVWVDLSIFTDEHKRAVDNGVRLSNFVYASFRFCPMGGLAYLFENNPKMLCDFNTYAPPSDILSFNVPASAVFGRNADEVNGTLGDIIPAPVGVDYVDDTEDIKALVADLLSPREREYFSLYMDGFPPSIIGERMGLDGNDYGSYGCRMRSKLRKNSAVILARLVANGYNVACSA